MVSKKIQPLFKRVFEFSRDVSTNYRCYFFQFRIFVGVIAVKRMIFVLTNLLLAPLSAASVSSEAALRNEFLQAERQIGSVSYQQAQKLLQKFDVEDVVKVDVDVGLERC